MPGRRQIQLQSTASLGMLPMAQKIMVREGVAGFYRGFLPNALKNLPNKGAAACEELISSRMCAVHSKSFCAWIALAHRDGEVGGESRHAADRAEVSI